MMLFLWNVEVNLLGINQRREKYYVIGFIFVLVVGALFTGNKKKLTYEEFCNLECWSRRKPCCIIS